MTHLLPAPVIVVLCVVLVTAMIDLWKFKVHNVITFPFLISGIAYHGVADGGAGVLNSILGALVGLVVLGVFYCLGGMGAGDVKLLTAIGAWLGVPLTFFVFVASALATGMYALILIVACGRFWDTWVNLKIIYDRLTTVARPPGADVSVEMALAKDDRRTRVIPFAAMVAVGLLGLLGVAWYFGES